MSHNDDLLDKKVLIEKGFAIATTIIGTLMLFVGSWTATMIREMSADIRTISQTTAVLTAQRVIDIERQTRLESRIDRIEGIIADLKSK